MRPLRPVLRRCSDNHGVIRWQGLAACAGASLRLWKVKDLLARKAGRQGIT